MSPATPWGVPTRLHVLCAVAQGGTSVERAYCINSMNSTIITGSRAPPGLEDSRATPLGEMDHGTVKTMWALLLLVTRRRLGGGDLSQGARIRLS